MRVLKVLRMTRYISTPMHKGDVVVCECVGGDARVVYSEGCPRVCGIGEVEVVKDVERFVVWKAMDALGLPRGVTALWCKRAEGAYVRVRSEW